MHICQYCGKTYKYATGKSRHIKLKHCGAPPSLQCYLCNMMFYTRWERAEHTAHCHPDYLRPCPFENCDKSFKNNTMLREHICRHTGEKPYKCSCGSSFICDSNYRRHKRSCMSIPAMFKCERCESRFRRRDALLAHLNKKRPCKPKPFKCDACGTRFTRKDALGVHKRTVCKRKIAGQRVLASQVE